MPIVDPTDIAGLVGWWDASDTATITDAGAGKCSQWNDKSGNGRNMTQGTDAQRPITGTRTIGGLNVLDFDGTNDNMVTAGITEASPYTIFVVYKSDATAASSDHILSRAGNSLLGMYAASGTMDKYASAGTIGYGGDVDTNEHYVSVVYNGASSGYWEDGVSVTLSPSNIGTTGFSAHALQASTAADPLNGVIGEIIFYDSALGTADREDVQAYLAGKWFAPPILVEVPAAATATAEAETPAVKDTIRVPAAATATAEAGRPAPTYGGQTTGQIWPPGAST